MNYFGGLTRQDVDSAAVYTCLRSAMRQVEPERPYRGPQLFQDGDWEYRDESRGDPISFEGEENIYYQGQQVYRLVYHGGQIYPQAG